VTLALALAGGLILALSGPPLDFVPGVWLGPAFLYAALALSPPIAPGRGRFRRWLRSGELGIAFGFACNAATFRFVPDVIVRFTPLPWAVGALAVVLLAAAHALRFFVTELAHRALQQYGVPRLFAFAFAMYVGTFVPMVFPWTPAGGAMTWPSSVQIAEIIGERGATALFALVSGLLAEGVLSLRAARRRNESLMPGLRSLIAATALFAVLTGGGKLRMSQIAAERAAAPKMKIALVQPSIEARERWEKNRAEAILTKLTRLTRAAESAGAELVVWPEAAYPYTLSQSGRRAPIGRYAPLQPGVHGPLLTGAIMHTDAEATNSAVVIGTDGTISEPYHKIHLLWFGETVPLADVFPWIRKTFARGMGLTPGEHQVMLPAGNVKAAVLNCFEDTLPGAGREAAGVSPNLLVNVTNDAWFAGSQESALHLRVASMRTIELRRDMIRAVNFGPTTWVDATGRIRGRLDPPEPGFLMTEPALLDRAPTFYARFGDVPFALLGVAALIGLVRERDRRRGRARAGD
jgi:apolipoprotein N-acyltransferase